MQPTQIGDYAVVRLLGRGGMSEVYEVENRRLGSRHALKLFTYEKDDAEVRERFLVEGRLLAKLSHPRIVKVTDFGTDAASGRPYFVMDLVLDENGGMRLLSDVAPGTVDEEQIGAWYDDLRLGLAYVHAHGVVHRDLKLQNVLIGPDGHAVITDFGISKICDMEGEGKTVVDTVKTLVKMRDGRNLVMGSLGYMAPELEMGVAASPASDYYALGVIVYRLLTGTWCDSRTDVVGSLDGYDPVWKRIIPKLLHSNPNGRECLSYADEKRADREKFEADAEERWLKEKQRGHLARHVARYVGSLSAVLALVLLFGARKYASDRQIWRLKLQNAGYVSQAVPDFDDVFRIPPEAAATNCVEAGRLVMPSRQMFEAARVDALVLTHDIFYGLKAGTVSHESAIREFESMEECFQEDSDRELAPFNKLSFDDSEYTPVGDVRALEILFERAVRRMHEIAGM